MITKTKVLVAAPVEFETPLGSWWKQNARPGSNEATANICRKKFHTRIAVPEGLPTQYDNHRPDVVEDLWCRLTVLFGASALVAGGHSPVFRTVGVTYAQLFSALEDDTRLSELAILVNQEFRNPEIGITFRPPSEIRMDPDGKWMRTTVVCPFYSDDFG